MKQVIALALVALAPATAGSVEIFACEPEWASLISEIAGNDAQVTVATTAFQDPHRLQAKPSLIAAIRDADLVVCTGADLEIGWLPLLLRRGGAPELFMAADHVRKLEVPKVVDRAQGDVHPQGNPHIHLDPRNVRRIADALAEKLASLDAPNADDYRRRLDLDIVATLESKPGIPPSGAQLASLLEKLSPRPPVGVIRTPYENEKPSLWLSERLSIPAIRLPYTVGGNPEVVDLFALFDETLTILEEYGQ